MILFTYLVKARDVTYSVNKDIQSVEEHMAKAIDAVSKHYPPGEGLRSSQQDYEAELAKLEIKGSNKGEFRLKPHQLAATDKVGQLQSIILNYTTVASSFCPDCEELIRSTCLPWCVSFKVGLKLSPDHPNSKSLLRIQ